MPKTDPITGCQVMTMGEFWASEAEREGKSPDELQEEFWNMLDEDNQRVCEELRENALKYLREPVYFADDVEDEACLAVLEILEIESVECSQNFRQSGAEIIAKVRLASGEHVRVKWYEWSSSGSFYEPPDGESGVSILGEN